MRDFEHIKRRILDRVDILDLASEHVTLKRSGRRWVGLCPFHSEKTPSFTVSPDYGAFKCFGCGKAGDIFTFVQLRENIPFIEALGFLADRAGVELEPAGRGPSGGPTRADVARANVWASRFFRSRLLDDRTGRSARAYLQSRQISDQTSERFNLGLATDDGGRGLQAAAARDGFDVPLLLAADLVRQGDDGHRYETFRQRLMFPIRDSGGRVIGFGGRTLVDDRAKYINTAQNVLFDKGRSLYGIDLARGAISDRRRVVVVEGYMDCLAAHQAGATETVAALGTALTERHVDLLRRYCEQIILLFDSDEAGEAAAERAIRVALPRCVTVRLARVPEGKDPSDFLRCSGADEFSDLLNRSVDALEFKWLRTHERFGGSGSDALRREAVFDFLRVVREAFDAGAVDAIQRGLLINQVAHLVRMDRGEVDHIMRGLRPRRADRGGPAARPAVGQHHRHPPDAEQAAWTHVLEVLLNEPAVFSATDWTPDVGRIADERDRRIATVVLELIERPGKFQARDVLARFEEPQDAERIMELVHRGAKRGNYEETFRSALTRIGVAARDERVERSKQDYFTAQGESGTSKETEAQFASFSKAVRERRGAGFVARRLSRPRVVEGSAAETAQTTPTVEQT